MLHSTVVIVARLRGAARRGLAALRRFGVQENGNIAITFALSLIPISLAIGAAVDYSFANSSRTHLNAVADAAALAAVSKSALKLSSSEAQKLALNVFKSQSSSIPRVTVNSVNAKVTDNTTQKLMDTAGTTQAVSGQFRMAIYTFGTTCTSLGLSTITAITSNLSSAKTAANAIDLMTIPYQGYNKDQCTDSDSALSSLNKVITTPGDGTKPSQPQKILFFVTDGVADVAKPSSCAKPVTSSTRCQEPFSTSYCEAIKKRGIKIAVLYTTYLPLPTNGWYNTWIAPFQTSIGSNMEKCASPGLYFEVSPTQGIAEAMLALFAKTVGQARLTQ